MTAWTDFLAGGRTVVPDLVGLILFATIADIATVNVGLSPTEVISLPARSLPLPHSD